MSQVKFKTSDCGRPIEVMAGWDPPCRHFFLTIFDLGDAEDEVLWSSVSAMPGGGCSTVEPLRSKLVRMAIPVPEGFWEQVSLCEGSVVTCHVDGEWKRRV